MYVCQGSSLTVGGASVCCFGGVRERRIQRGQLCQFGMGHQRNFLR